MKPDTEPSNEARSSRVTAIVGDSTAPAVQALAAAAADLAREHTDHPVTVSAGDIVGEPDAALMWAVPDVEAAFSCLVPGARLLWGGSVHTVEAFGTDVSSYEPDESRHLSLEGEDAPDALHERLLRDWFATPIPFAVVHVPTAADVSAATRERGVRHIAAGDTGPTIPPAERPAFALPSVPGETATTDVAVGEERAPEADEEPTIRDLPMADGGEKA